MTPFSTRGHLSSSNLTLVILNQLQSVVRRYLLPVNFTRRGAALGTICRPPAAAMDPLDPNRPFFEQLTEPDPTYYSHTASTQYAQPHPQPQPQLFASQRSNQVVNQLVAPSDYLQAQRATIAERINSARVVNSFAPPSAPKFNYSHPLQVPGSSSSYPLQPQPSNIVRSLGMDKRHPSSFQQLEKVSDPSPDGSIFILMFHSWARVPMQPYALNLMKCPGTFTDLRSQGVQRSQSPNWRTRRAERDSS